MNPERWQQVEQIFQAALDQEPAARAAFLGQACAGDQELRREVDSLLGCVGGVTEFVDGVVGRAVGWVARPPAPVVGRRIGLYRIDRELARGGMGEVYLAVRADGEFEKQVAIKLVKHGMDTDAVLERFRHERQILAQLEHPHIARLIDGGATGEGRPYLVMEYVDGESITAYCDKRRLSLVQRLELFQQVCAAAHYAHQNLVVHRDLKPNNILVTAGGIPKLVDFGIAKVLRPEPEAPEGPDLATLTEFRALTPQYASPEQVEGRPITTAADVYALGAILYELLTGRRAHVFETTTPQEVHRVVCEAQTERPSSVARSRQLAGDLDNIVLMALRKDPRRRYSSAEQFSDDIRRYLDGLPVIARQDTLAYRWGKFLVRNRLAVAASVLIVASLVAGMAMTARQARIAERRFQDVRKLANSVVFELHDAIQTLPGSTPARKLLVERALEYLDRLSREAEADRALKLELAAAYQKVGDVQGHPFQANLGDTAGAMASFRKAQALRLGLAASGPADRQVQKDLVSGYAVIGDIQHQQGDTAGALETYRRAMTMAAAVSAADPADTAAKESWAKGLTRLGGLEIDAGDSRAGLDQYRKASELYAELIAKTPADRRARRNLSSIHVLIGTAQSRAGDPAPALENFRTALAIREALVAEEPNNAGFRRDLWLNLNSVADVLGNPNLHNLGRTAEALAYYRKAFAIAETAAAADPKNRRARRDVMLSLVRLADTLLASGDSKSAIAAYRRSLATNVALIELDPQNKEVRRDLAIADDRLGKALEKAGNRKEALVYYRRALDLRLSLAAADAKNARLRHDLLDSRAFLGNFFLDQGDWKGAVGEFQKGREMAESLAAADPASSEAQRAAAAFCERLGETHLRMAAAGPQAAEHRRQAAQYFQLAADRLSSFLKPGSAFPQDREELSRLREKIAALKPTQQ